jgi:hypothetical protein
MKIEKGPIKIVCVHNQSILILQLRVVAKSILYYNTWDLLDLIIHYEWYLKKNHPLWRFMIQKLKQNKQKNQQK